jgi:UPF0271 protein
MRIDLNCDVGESAEAERLAVEERIVPHVTSVNVACGVHAGNQEVMRRTVRLACHHHLAVGGHPGFADLEGQGRRNLTLPPGEVENLVAYQVGALGGLAALEGVKLNHVKPHGALYNMAAADRSLAEAIVRAVAAVDRRLILYGLAGSLLIEAGHEAGLAIAEEAFADRAYEADGTLVPRDRPGALIQDEQKVVEQVLRIVREGIVRSLDGRELALRADTICLHGDTPGADRLAQLIRRSLEEAGVLVAAVSSGGISRDG